MVIQTGQDIEQALAHYETQYGMTSDEFWRRYQAGQTEDSADFMEWNVLCKMKQRLKLVSESSL